MRNMLILAAVAAAVVGIAALKLRRSSPDAASSGCPCTMVQKAITNETAEGLSDVE